MNEETIIIPNGLENHSIINCLYTTNVNEDSDPFSNDFASSAEEDQYYM